MLFLLLLIVPFASAVEHNRCADVAITVPDTPCPQGQIKCPKFDTTLEKDSRGYGCPIEMTCEDMWFSQNKTCMRACWDVICPYGEIPMAYAMLDYVVGFGNCDRMQNFCAKFPEYPGNDNLMDWADLGLEPTNVYETASIVWPQSCGANEIWCQRGFDNDGYWLGSWCAKDATECENEIEGFNTDIAD